MISFANPDLCKNRANKASITDRESTVVENIWLVEMTSELI